VLRQMDDTYDLIFEFDLDVVSSIFSIGCLDLFTVPYCQAPLLLSATAPLESTSTAGSPAEC